MRIGAERHRSFGNHNLERAKASCLVFLEALCGGRSVIHSRCPVHCSNLCDLVLEGIRIFVEGTNLRIGGFFTRSSYFTCKLARAFTALNDTEGARHTYPGLGTNFLDLSELGLVVGGEDIDRNHGVQAETADNLNVLEKVCATRANLFDVFLGHSIGQGFARSKPVLTGVGLERANRRDDHRAIGTQTAHGALDIEETLGTHIRAKTGLGHHVITVLPSKAVRDHRGASRCNIAEGTGVNQDRAALSRAQKVRAEGIAKERSHCSRSLQVLGGDIFAGLILTDHNASQTLAKIRVRGGKGHDDHDLAGSGDIKG